MTTTGYKRQRPEFQDLIYENLRRVGSTSSDAGTIVPTGVQVGLGVKTGAISRNHAQGTVQPTENALDIAIQGKGFFVIQQPDGTPAYTRDGSFQLSEEGQIVTRDGYPVEPNMTVPDDAVSISVSKDGLVDVTLQGQVDPVNVGQFQLASFINEAGLQAIGDNLYLETTASGAVLEGNPNEDSFGGLLQGYVENSNVNPVSEITNLIVAQRAYEMNTKVITTSDEMMQSLNQSA
jgi:flagellar basal-body rod protein FlgG